MMHAPKLPGGLQSAWLLDCEVFAEAFHPDPELTITEWADERRILPPESSPEPGPWRTERVPYAREIMDVLSPSDPTSEVTFVAGAQVAKTEIGNNFIGFIIDYAPGPVMMVYATSSTGKRSSHTRLAKMLESTPTLREKVTNRSRDKGNSTTRKDFPGGVLMIAGANSAPDLAGQPVRYLFLDEVDKYPEDVDGHGPAVELAETRARNFSRKKIYRASTPTENAPRKIWGFWLASDMRRYHVPCPHCGELQVLHWEQFRYETSKVWEIVDTELGEIREVAPETEGAKARDTGQVLDVWYECEHCRVRIDEHHKTAMLAQGRWIASRPEVKGRAGFHLPSYYSPLGWYSWASIVTKRLEADQDPTGQLLKQWTNETAGEAYTAQGEQVSNLALKERAEKYKLGTVPMGGLLLTASVDVQANRLEVKVKAWGRGEESWLVEHQVIFGDTETSAPWTTLDEYLQKSFPHEIGAKLRILATAVDAGYRTQTVYAFCRPRAHRHIFPVRGQSQQGKTVLGRPSAQDVDHKGEKIPNGIQLWPVGADTAKSKIYARLKIEMPGPGCMHFPLGLPDEYYQQLTAERYVPKYVNGYLKRVWEKDATARNEALDLEVYAYAAAIYAGVTRVNWDKLEAGLRMTAEDLFVQAQAKEEATSGDAERASVQTSGLPRRSGAAARPQAVPRRSSGFINRWKT
jgi:phage terminase large subunit GpA-like protein